ncbi:hypothetical protein [Limnothrix redekei]|uniref:Uncharacterized protein n=1 Tax=Limnothrix redekei LRLZ20PSL1 TaxID=3112953 RepID=A0ABW7CH45_9CYAN
MACASMGLLGFQERRQGILQAAHGAGPRAIAQVSLSVPRDAIG